MTEGIEDTLDIRHCGWRPIWALGSAGAARAFAPLAGICLTIFADADPSDSMRRGHAPTCRPGGRHSPAAWRERLERGGR